MMRITPVPIATTLLQSPAWACLGLTVRDDRLRARATDALAARIAADLNDDPVADHRQMALPL